MRNWFGIALVLIFFNGVYLQAAHSSKSSTSRSTVKDTSNSVVDIGILGMRFGVHNGQSAVIDKVFPDTPAEKSQLQVGDVILAVDTVPTAGLTKDEIYNMLVGDPESKVTLTIKRRSTTFSKTLTRMHSREFARAHPDFWKAYDPVPGK